MLTRAEITRAYRARQVAEGKIPPPKSGSAFATHQKTSRDADIEFVYWADSNGFDLRRFSPKAAR